MKGYNESAIPEELRFLIPYAQRWGINCDVKRNEYFESQPKRDILGFVDTYEPYQEKVNEWLDTYSVDEKWPDEAESYLYMNKAYCDAYFMVEKHKA